MNPKLTDYVKQQLEQGASKETIYSSLISAGGWSPADVNAALSAHGANISTDPQLAGSVPTVPVKYAGFWIRFVALVLDGVIIAIPSGILNLVVTSILTKSGLMILGVKIWVNIISMLAGWTYFSLMTYNYDATLGKMLLGLSVKSEDFQKLSLGRVILRETVGKLLSTITIFIGYIMVGFTEKKQGLHDKVAHSVVVYKNPSESHKIALIIGIILAAILPIIAIIGILSAVVLASLSTAQEKSKDAADMAEISTMRTNAELFYSENNNSYLVSKSCDSGMFADNRINQAISTFDKDSAVCYAEGPTYAVSVKSNGTSKDICVDSSSYIVTGVAVDDGNVASCQVAGEDSADSNATSSVFKFDG